MSKAILSAATLFVTNRVRFNEDYGDTIHDQYLNMLFIDAATRPELAETLAITTLGYTPINTKHGFDGYDETNKRHIEAKITTTSTIINEKGKVKLKRAIGPITINDPSDNIIKKYNKENPLFILSYYIDGHLCATFSVEWKIMKPLYVSGVKKIKKKGGGARNFSIKVDDWNTNCNVVFTNKDPIIYGTLPKKLLAILVD